MLITYKKLSSNQKSTYYYILCYFPIQYCVSLCIGCTGKRSGISVKGLRKFPSNEGLFGLCENRILTFKIIFWHSNWGRISYFDFRNSILTFEMGPKILWWHSIGPVNSILTFKILFWHSNWGRISNFEIHSPILTFDLGPNIAFWHLKSYFDIRTGAEYRILTFKSNFDIRTMPNIVFDIRNPTLIFKKWPENRILTFKILFWNSNGPNIVIWHSKSYFDIQNCPGNLNLTLWNPILTFKVGPNFEIWHSNPILTFEMVPKIVFCHSKSYFDIQTGAEYRIFTFEILFWHSKWARKSYFDIQNPFLTFELWPNIEVWHSKSYFDNRSGAEYRMLTFKILFWYSKWARKSYFDIQNPILTLELGPNIVFWLSKSYFDIRTGPENRILTFKSNFDIRTGADYRILTFQILYWYSNLGRISNFEIESPILTFELGLNIEYWHLKDYFDIRTGAEYRILKFKIQVWNSNRGRISYFDIRNPTLHSK